MKKNIALILAAALVPADRNAAAAVAQTPEFPASAEQRQRIRWY